MVNELLDELQFADRDRTLTGAELRGQRADFGLDQPRLKLTVQTKKGAVTLLVGKATPTGRMPLIFSFRAGRTWRWPTRASPTGSTSRWRTCATRPCLISARVAIAGVEIRADKRVVELARVSALTNAEPRWALVQPLAARADQQKVSQLLNDLTGLARRLDFVSENPQDVHT